MTNFNPPTAYGTGSIASGATSTIINHGMPVTPNAGNINITPSAVTTSAVGLIYVDTIGAKSFTVHTTNDPSTSGFSFGWDCYVPN
jgi:hypothetical protein